MIFLRPLTSQVAARLRSLDERANPWLDRALAATPAAPTAPRSIDGGRPMRRRRNLSTAIDHLADRADALDLASAAGVLSTAALFVDVTNPSPRVRRFAIARRRNRPTVVALAADVAASPFVTGTPSMSSSTRIECALATSIAIGADEGVAALPRKHDVARATDAFAASRVIAQSAHLRGGWRPRDFALHRSWCRHAIELDERSAGARYHAVRVAIRAADWDTALWATGSRLRSDDLRCPDAELADLLVATAPDPSDPISGDYWFVAHWLLHARGLLRDAWQAKLRLANDLVDRRAPAGSSLWFRRVQAMILLEEFAEADATLQAASSTARPTARRRAEHMRHDIRVLTADAPVRPPDVDGGFGKLVRGRAIVLVGPTDEDVDVFAAADVVVGPKIVGERADRMRQAGATTIVSYVTDETVALAHERLSADLAAGRIDAVVVRPLGIDRSLGLGERRGFMRAGEESGVHLDAASFAIPRMLYDVLGHQPSEVTITGADLFVSGRYAAGYDIEAAPAAARGIQRNLSGYGHDLVSDFRLMRALCRSPQVTTGTTLDCVLGLDEPHYLAKVEATRR